MGGDNSVIPSDAIPGVINLPRSAPTAVISMDLCEVVRSSALSLLRIPGGDLSDMVYDVTTGFHDYGSRSNGIPDARAQPWRQLHLQQFMNHDVVEPVPYNETIVAFMKKWQNNGVYIFANTSTLPGCELATVEFLQTYYPGCFQGIMLPGNHDGNGATTKVDALGEVLSALELAGTGTIGHTIAVEDATHHIKTYQEHNVTTFVPSYGWNAPTDGLSGVERISTERLGGTIEAFVALDQYLAALDL